MPEEPPYIVDIDDLNAVEDDSGSRRNRRNRWLGVRFDWRSFVAIKLEWQHRESDSFASDVGAVQLSVSF